MIVGGYNTIDFEGAVFVSDKPETISDDKLSKLLDNSKPVLMGNFTKTVTFIVD